MRGLWMNSVRKRHLFCGKSTEGVELERTAPTQTQFAFGLQSNEAAPFPLCEQKQTL